MPKIAPRSLLLMSGSEDTDTPPAVMRKIAADAPGAELWIVHGAGHGGYLDVGPAGSSKKFSGFFDRSLTISGSLR